MSDLSRIRTQGVAHVTALALSDVFRSFNARDFPGMQESSELAKHFAEQGIKIPIRRKTRQKRSGASATSAAAAAATAAASAEAGDGTVVVATTAGGGGG
ncbi:hypothetical protein HK104_002951, partial [Borealophlyctis nickersoniae]